MSAPAGSPARILRAYVIGHAVALVVYWFVPRGSWPHPLWQMIVTSISAGFLVMGVRRLRPEGAIGWYLIAAGVWVNSWGVVVELMLRRWFDVQSSPNVADIFWSALFPAVSIGLAILVRRAAAREDPAAMLLNTVICVPLTFFAGVHAWHLLAWRTHHHQGVPLAYKIVVTAYPFGDLIFLALLLRLLLSIGVKNVSIVLMLAWMVLLLPSDLGWPSFVQSGTLPGRGMQYFMEATWMAANAFLGAATWHPDVHKITRSLDGHVPPLGTFGWLSLLLCALMAPLVVVFQIVLDRLYSLSSF